MVQQCPSQEELSGFVFGTLSEADADTVTNHLLGCNACEDTVQEIERTADQMVEGLRQPAGEDPFTQESGCDRVVELVAAIGRDPSFTRIAGGEPPAPVELPDLGTIRSYRLIEKLGQGGMGSVFKALHLDLDKVVALKVLPKECTQDEAAIARFRREMKAVGKLSHHHIVQATDAGQEDGTHYLVMELVDGSDLSKLVANRGPLPIADACELIRQAAEGLQHAHEHGLVHRDIKPSNLMLTTNGTVKILDLGLALLGGQHHEGQGELTTTGQIMGTIDYMAPEQGSDTHNVDIRADVYSLGATLFKLLTGKAPFEGEQYKTPIKKLMALANVEAPRVDDVRPDVPKALADLVERMLSKSPKERPTPPSELARLLAPFAAGANLLRLISGSDEDSEPATEEKPAAGSTAATILVDTDVSGTLDAVPGTLARSASKGSGSDDPVVTRSESEGTGSDDSQATPTTPVGTSPAAEPSFPTIVDASEPRIAPRRSRSWVSKNLDKVLIAGGLVVLLMGVVLFKFVTRDGTVYIELPEGIPSVTVTIDGEEAEIEFAEDRSSLRLFVDPGTHDLVVTTPNNIRLTTDNNRFEMSAGGEQRIRAWLEPPTEVERMPNDGGTQLASTQPATTGTNYALQFDGIDDFALLRGLHYDGSHPITVEFRARPESRSFENAGSALFHRSLRTFVRDDHRNSGHTWAVYTTLQDASIQENGTGTPGEIIASEREPLQIDCHVAVTYDGTHVRMFVDGRFEGEVNGAGLPLFTEPNHFVIGGTFEEAPNGAFHGVIDEVRISSIVRYTEDYVPEARFENDEHTLALYHFDEGDGETLVDSSGNGHHGTIHGATWVKEVAPGTWVPHVPSNFALAFDGVEDWVEVPSFRMDGTQPWTIEGYFSSPNNEVGDLISYPGGLRLWVADHIVYGRVVSTTSEHIEAGAGRSGEGFSRTHVAFVFDGEALRVFLDGVPGERRPLDAEINFISDENNSEGAIQRLVMGRLAHPFRLDDFFFEGTLDEVRISSTARYTEDFTPAPRFETDEHTLALYHFDEGVGETLVDSSGNGHHGTIHGATWMREVAPNRWVPADANLNNYALQFNGVGGVTIPTLNCIDGEPMTVEAYVWPHRADGNGRVVMMWGAVPMGLLVGQNTILANTSRGGVSHGLRHPIEDPIGRPLHLASVWDGSELRLYVNGQSCGEPYGTGAHATFDEQFTQIAGPPLNEVASAGLAWFHGIIDEVRISDTARYTDDFTPESRFEVDEHTLALYHFDEGQGETLIDSSGNEHHGTIHGATWVREVSPGQWGPAIDFDYEREVAEWVLARGGTMHVRVLSHGEWIRVNPGSQLPDEEFWIAGVALQENDLSADDAARLSLLSRIVGLDLIGARIADDAWSLLGQISTVRQLHLNEVQLGDAQFAALGNLTGIEQLSLIGVDLSDASLPIIGRMRNLNMLNLSSPAITDVGLSEIVHLDQMQELWLEGCSITDAGLSHLSSMSQLRHLAVTGDGITDAALPFILQHESLEALALQNTRVSDAGLGQLRELAKLKTLLLRGTDVTDTGMAKLAEISTLEFISLADCAAITDAGLVPLHRLRKLRELNLTLTGVTDAGLATLHNFTTLRNVVVSNTEVTAEGVAALHEALPNCRIEWDGGVIEPTAGPASGNFALQFDGDDGYVEIPAIPHQASEDLTIEAYVRPESPTSAGVVLQGSNGLYSLYHTATDSQYYPESWIFGHSVGDGCLNAISRERVEFNRTIHLAAVWHEQHVKLFVDGQLASAEDTGFWHNNPDIETLFVGGKRDAAGVVTAAFDGIIDEVRISNIARYTEDFTPEAQFEVDEHTLALYHFDEGDGETLVDSSGNGHHGTIHGATWVRVGDVDRDIAKLILNLGGRVRVAPTDDGNDLTIWIESLEQLPVGSMTVTHVDLNRVANFEVALSRLHELDGLRSLGLTSSQLDDGMLTQISRLTRLLSLGLAGSSITDAGLDQLKDLKQLEILWLENTAVTDAGVAHLVDLPRLRSLWLYGCPLTDDSVESIASMASLRDLHLGDTRVSEDGAQRIRDAIPDCRVLTESVLSRDNDNHALRFDGVDDGVEVPSLAYDGSHPLTMEAWIRPSEVRPEHGEAVLTCNFLVMGLSQSDEGVRWRGYGNFDPSQHDLFAPYTPTAGGLRHLAIVFDNEATTLTLFVDGEKIWSLTADSFVENPGARLLTIGKSLEASPLGHFSGVIDEVRLSSVARYAESFTPETRFEVDENTLALYHFDQTEGETLFDASGNGHHGTIHGATWVRNNVGNDQAVIEWVRSLGGDIGLAGAGVDYMNVLADEDLPEGDFSLVTLDLHQKSVTDDDLARLDGLLRFTTLIISDTPVGDTGFARLGELPVLDKLYIAGTEIGDDGLASLTERYPQVFILHAGATNLTDAGVAALVNWPKIEQLYIQTLPLTDASVDTLVQLTELKELLITGTEITQTGVQRLHEALPHCRISSDFGVIEAEE